MKQIIGLEAYEMRSLFDGRRIEIQTERGPVFLEYLPDAPDQGETRRNGGPPRTRAPRPRREWRPAARKAKAVAKPPVLRKRRGPPTPWTCPRCQAHLTTRQKGAHMMGHANRARHRARRLRKSPVKEAAAT